MLGKSPKIIMLRHISVKIGVFGNYFCLKSLQSAAAIRADCFIVRQLIHVEYFVTRCTGEGVLVVTGRLFPGDRTGTLGLRLAMVLHESLYLPESIKHFFGLAINAVHEIWHQHSQNGHYEQEQTDY